MHQVAQTRLTKQASPLVMLQSEAEGTAEATAEEAPVAAEEAGDDLPSPGDDLSAAAEKLTLEQLEIDSMVEGTVKGVSDFGAFVDFGATSDGLVHKSQLSDDFVENPADFVKVGDKVTVRVMRVDLDKNQISLSMKSKGSGDRPARREGGGGRGGADMSKYEAMAKDAFMPGKVKTIATYGAFIELEDGMSGLVHISQMAEGRTESVEDVVSQGQEVQVRVLNVRDGKLSLAMSPYVEGSEKDEQGGQKRRGGGGRDEEGDNFPGMRRQREERVDDIWSDNTEPKWAEIMAETNKEVMDNVLELKL